MENKNEGSEKHEESEFKKPILIGRIGKLPKKAKAENEFVTEQCDSEKNIKVSSDTNVQISLPPAVSIKDTSTPVSYKEPKWSGLCPEGSEYGLEVLKSGMIVQNIDMMTKPYYVFGRLDNCEVVMAHPTISRYHAILQYKAIAEEGEYPVGWYLYDLGSTHGTFLNRERLKERHYTRVRVGHQIKFGTSTRTYILYGPDFDVEGESELTVTEIKKKAQDMKLEKERLIQEAIEQREKDKLDAERKREEQGIDWGMGEDAEDEPDLTENPYATTVNEELYLEDPKKTLRGYFEREGHELVYDCEERGVGQFLCRVELPMDDARGNSVVAEVIHKGKKKDSVIACALEACRILDRAGLLRQAKHESRRRKERDWSVDDYYDSDEDTFLDRTGSVEKKRRARMEKLGAVAHEGNQSVTYDDLIKQISEIEDTIASEEKVLDRLRASNKSKKEANNEEDDLDEYMNSLGSQGQSMANKADISKTKMNIQKLKGQLTKTQRLAEIARPAHAPPIIKKDENKMSVKQTNSVVYGKRLRLKEDIEKRPKMKQERKQDDKEFVEEIDSDEEIQITEDTVSRTDVKVEKEETVVPLKKETTEQLKIEAKIEKHEKKETKEIIKAENKEKRVFGPMRPPENYVIPESYFDQETDRDLPEIEEKDKL